MTSNLDVETVIASMLIAKYAGIVVLSDFKGDALFPLLLERLNIFTDPQRPMTVTEGIYEVGAPDENSPVLVTTNFSLTAFSISLRAIRPSACGLSGLAQGFSVKEIRNSRTFGSKGDEAL